MMDHNPDRLSIWPGYFDAKTSRRSGRRVPRDSSVLKPDLDSLFYAARKVGLKKIKREEQISHPNRPYGKEGRLWVSRSGAKKSIGASNKEEILQMIGAEWRQMQKLARGETEPEAPPRVIRHGELQIRGNQTTYNLNSILANNIKASMYYIKIRQ